jgi:hypothetical protein
VGENIDTIQKTQKSCSMLLRKLAWKWIKKKTKYMLVSRCQKAGQRQSIKIVNRSFEGMAKFNYLGTALTNQICIHKEIKSWLN